MEKVWVQRMLNDDSTQENPFDDPCLDDEAKRKLLIAYSPTCSHIQTLIAKGDLKRFEIFDTVVSKEELEEFAKTVPFFGGSDIEEEFEEIPQCCTLCGNVSHTSRNCNNLGKNQKNAESRVCFYCKQEGHIRSQCPKKQAKSCRQKKKQSLKNENEDTNNLTHQSCDSISTRSESRESSAKDVPVKNKWSIVIHPGNCSNFVQVPMPKPASKKPTIRLRSQLSSSNASQRGLDAKKRSRKKSKYIRSDSEDSDQASDMENIFVTPSLANNVKIKQKENVVKHISHDSNCIKDNKELDDDMNLQMELGVLEQLQYVHLDSDAFVEVKLGDNDIAENGCITDGTVGDNLSDSSNFSGSLCGDESKQTTSQIKC
ncbi:hypothetical protein Ddc_04121 [Ditylenchus destructor]|nr:hypothetical protein Ddc_04121 [Ditylenchus destructor]